MLKTIKQNIQDHKKANELLYKQPQTCEQNNEFHINWEFPKAYENYHLSCKSLLDRLMIDHTLKKITLVDLKLLLMYGILNILLKSMIIEDN